MINFMFVFLENIVHIAMLDLYGYYIRQESSMKCKAALIL